MPKFILWPEKPDIKVNCLDAVNGLDPEKTWDVVIKRHVNSKTKKQRGWFHVLCQILGDEIGMHEGQIKEIAKAQLFGWKKFTYGGVELVMADGHSETLNGIRYGQLTDIVYQMGSDAGIQLPPPDPYRKAR